MSTDPGPTGRPANAPVKPPPSSEGTRPSYSAIGRHLTVLRDAASAVLALFAPPDVPEPKVGEAGASPSPGKKREPGRRPKSPLAARIERHAAIIDRALSITARLNPDRLSRWELPQVVSDDLGWQDQVI